MSSFASVKGPSTRVRLCPEYWMRQPFALAWSPEASSSTPAFCSSSWYFAISARLVSRGITPASESFVAFTMIMNRMVPPSLGAQRNECPQPVLAEVQPSPDQQSDIDRKQRGGKEWTADAHLGCDCAAEITGQQDRAENGGAWNQVRHHAKELEDSETESEAHGIPELSECIDYGSDLQHVYDAVEEQEQRGQSAHDASHPEPFLH